MIFMLTKNVIYGFILYMIIDKLKVTHVPRTEVYDLNILHKIQYHKLT